MKLSFDSTQEDFDAKFSGYAEAVVFGVISEKIRIIIVRIIDPSKTLPSKKFIISIVTSAEAKIFAKLLPTRITDNKLSGFESSFRALAEFFSPDFALFLNFILFDAIIPVSDPEKNADKSNKNIIEVIKINKEGSSDIKNYIFTKKAIIIKIIDKKL
tara:strand:+ start:312 stop:785 length:474 start_codon:yes stop_codon:yes gene_type:complete